MNLAFQTKLAPVEYPEPILVAAGNCRPGEVVPLSDALEASVQISEVSPDLCVDHPTGALRGGPFGAVRLAVRRREFMDLLHSLRGQPPNEVAEQVLQVRGLVVGVGSNTVNGAQLDAASWFTDPTAHAEMVAIRSACRALGIPMHAWRERDLICVEGSSCENCDMCRFANGLWSGLALSVFAAAGYDAAHMGDAPGFHEREDANEQHSLPPEIVWGNTDCANPQFAGTHLFLGSKTLQPQLRERARRAMAKFVRLGGKPYQPC